MKLVIAQNDKLHSCNISAQVKYGLPSLWGCHEPTSFRLASQGSCISFVPHYPVYSNGPELSQSLLSGSLSFTEGRKAKF